MCVRAVNDHFIIEIEQKKNKALNYIHPSIQLDVTNLKNVQVVISAIEPNRLQCSALPLNSYYTHDTMLLN